jgi:hypothetical protein
MNGGPFGCVTMVLQWCCTGATMMLQRCYNGITMVFPWCYAVTCWQGLCAREAGQGSHPPERVYNRVTLV